MEKKQTLLWLLNLYSMRSNMGNEEFEITEPVQQGTDFVYNIKVKDQFTKDLIEL
jgi:hypothetical protein